jgi:hypothetical protein
MMSRKNVCVTLDKMHGKTDVAHSNPLRRVTVLDLLTQARTIIETDILRCLEAAETALGY